MTDSAALRTIAGPRHGGDLDFATMHYGEPPDGWLDLSTGVNPEPYRVANRAPTGDHRRLPGQDALAQLIATALRAYRLQAAVPVVATPGSEIAIRLLPVVAPPGKVAIVSPTYRSHGEAWVNAGREVVAVGSLDAVPADTTIAVVTNPNNPDGRVVAAEQLVDLSERLGQAGGLLVVDEAFADLTSEASLAPHLGGLRAVVLRSLGKFYGLPGLRLGFAAGWAPSVDRLASLLGDWPVSSAALTAGTAALADAAWRDETRHRLTRLAKRLRRLLASHHLAVAGGTDLFVLIDDAGAGALHRGLAERGIWTRAFPEKPTWLRVGLPGDEEGFARLDGALGEVLALTAVD